MSHYVIIIGGDQPYQDYKKQFFTYELRNESLSGLHRTICYNQTVYSDERLEKEEDVRLTLQIQDLEEIPGPTTVTTVVGARHADVRIIDDDGNLIVALMLHASL